MSECDRERRVKEGTERERERDGERRVKDGTERESLI